MKEQIRQFALETGVDDVGFVAVADYHSPRSPKVEAIHPGAKSMVVLAYRELSTCESDRKEIALNGRLDLMEFSRSCNYKLARFLEREYGARAMTVPVSYPLDFGPEAKGAVGEVSLRHAAVAAGLGVFGRHNIALHPKFGSRVIFSAVLCDIELSTDSPVQENLCIQCDLCVKSCPGGALDEEGKTHLGKCIKNSQPYGLGANIGFWTKYTESSLEEQKKMFKSEEFWRMYQAGFIGFQYFCFNCLKSCPVGQK
ncbi:MAG: 4Fe-4S binding protein [Thermincolia bacterium]